MWTLQTRMASQNPTLFMNIYRASESTSVKSLFPEIEQCLTAYYGLQDDCEGHPEWQRKIEEELGGSLSYLAMQMDEISRDEACEKSVAFHRFDMEK